MQVTQQSLEANGSIYTAQVLIPAGNEDALWIIEHAFCSRKWAKTDGGPDVNDVR